MEVTGVEMIFGMSIEKTFLRYAEYYGDSISFAAVENVYGEKMTKK